MISRIAYKLGISKKIYARNCDVSEVSKLEAADFLKRYHLQETVPFDYGMKLVYNNEIVAVMTFGKPLLSNSTHENGWELKRYCSIPHIQITGGADKLFKHSILEAKSRKIPSIFTYCDLRWGTGKVYQALGFELLTDAATKPSPHIINGLKRSRSHSSNLDENLIYDCGHQKWLYRLDPTISQSDNSQRSIQP